MPTLHSEKQGVWQQAIEGYVPDEFTSITR